jgi:hypothetical protein
MVEWTALNVLLIEHCTGFEVGEILGMWDLNVLY